MIVVIPTMRQPNLAFLRPLIEAGARFIVVDDSEGRVTVDHPSFRVFNWNDQARILGERVRAIPRRNGACRDFGFYLAWLESDDDELIIALDDDIELPADFVESLNVVFSDAERPVADAPGRHLNIFDLYEEVPNRIFPRGYPYSCRPDYAPCSFSEPRPANPIFSLGIWKGVFDVNGIDKLQGPAYVHPDVSLKHLSVTVAPGKLISVCSGSMAFRREVLPAVYQLPMHVEAMPGWVIDRCGDIWGGWILKTLMDLKGDGMAAGGPLVHHSIEGPNTKNLWKEHIFHLVTDEYLEVLASAAAELKPARYEEMMGALADIFARDASRRSPLLRGYMRHLADCMGTWAEILVTGNETYRQSIVAPAEASPVASPMAEAGMPR
jgi:hypothetical protein